MKVDIRVADADWHESSAITAYWAANLLLRIGHDVSWHLPDSPLAVSGLPRPSVQETLAHAKSSFPQTPTDAGEITVNVAPVVVPGSLTIWSDGWTVWVNQTAVASWGDRNPATAALAGGLVAAAVQAMVEGRALRPFTFNFSTYTSEPQRGAVPAGVTLPAAVLAGCGSVGSAYVLVLGHTRPNLDLEIVDPETVDAGNVIRYVTAFPDSGWPEKVRAAEELLQAAGVAARGHVGDAVSFTNEPKGLVVCAVHDAETRRQLASNLPRLVLDGAIGLGIVSPASACVEISTASFPPAGACLACIYHDGVSNAAPGNCADAPEPDAVADMRPRRIFGPAIAGALLAGRHIQLATADSEAPSASFRWDVFFPPTHEHVTAAAARTGCIVCGRAEYAREHARIWGKSSQSAPSRSLSGGGK